MREVSRLSALTVVLLLTGPATALAQQRGGSVPEEFVRAMVGADAGLLIGELPEDLAGILPLPDGSRVIGSVTHDAMSIAYVSVAADPDTAVAFFRDQMVVEAGWRTPEEREPPRGFQRPAAERASASFCGPAGELLSVSAAETGTETIARVQYYPEFPGRLPCDRPSRVERWNELEPRLPILNVPPDEFRRGTGTGSGLDSSWTGVELSSERTAAEIADGIAAQITAEGWTPGFSADDEQVAVRTWTRTFEDGFQAKGSLMVLLLGSGTYEALFRLARMR